MRILLSHVMLAWRKGNLKCICNLWANNGVEYFIYLDNFSW